MVHHVQRVKGLGRRKKNAKTMLPAKVLVSIPLFILQIDVHLFYAQTRYFTLKKYKVLDIITKFLICFPGKRFVLPAQNNYQVFTPLSTTQ